MNNIIGHNYFLFDRINQRSSHVSNQSKRNAGISSASSNINKSKTTKIRTLTIISKTHSQLGKESRVDDVLDERFVSLNDSRQIYLLVGTAYHLKMGEKLFQHGLVN